MLVQKIWKKAIFYILHIWNWVSLKKCFSVLNNMCDVINHVIMFTSHISLCNVINNLKSLNFIKYDFFRLFAFSDIYRIDFSQYVSAINQTYGMCRANCEKSQTNIDLDLWKGKRILIFRNRVRLHELTFPGHRQTFDICSGNNRQRYRSDEGRRGMIRDIPRTC